MKKTINIMKRLFEVRYEMELDFQWSWNLSKDKFLFWSKCEKPFIYSKNLKKAFFPVFPSGKSLKALITVQPVLKKDCLGEIADFFNLTVSEPLRLNEIALEQNQKEDLLKRLLADPKKVIPFKAKYSIN